MAADGRGERASIRQLLGLLPEAGRLGDRRPGGHEGPVQVVVPLAVISTTGALVGRVTAGAGLGAVTGLLAVAGRPVRGPAVHAGCWANVLWYRATSRIDGSDAGPGHGGGARPPGVELLEDQAVQDVLPLAAGKPLPFRYATPGARRSG